MTTNTATPETNPLILVTGAAGYVGSHCLVELLEANYDVVALDNCTNAILLPGQSIPESLIRVQQIAKRPLVRFYLADITDAKKMEEIFSQHQFVAVMHFAALKAVAESCQKPLHYYYNNVGGTITLLETMRKFGVKRFIFSSSATVYGRPDRLPIDERHRTGSDCTNPYGRTKYFIEEILKDVCSSDAEWCAVSLRYFNPVGAHDSGEIGEDPQGVPNNLMPYISQVAVGRQPYLKVFGNDFQTEDGTGVRDYIHIMDLAAGHLVTLDHLLRHNWTGWNVYNFGAGTGYSVLDVINAFEDSTGARVPYKICNRRPGDVDELWADIGKASNHLDWRPRRGLHEMCAHSWQWQSRYPMGYRTLLDGSQNLNGDSCKANSHHQHQDQFNSRNSNGSHKPSSPKTNGKLVSVSPPPPLIGKTKRLPTILNGKHFPLEVNNNDEDIVV